MYKVGDKFIDMIDNSHIKIKEIIKNQFDNEDGYEIVLNGMFLENVDGEYLRVYCRKLEE